MSPSGHLNVSLLQAITFCQIIELITALLTRVVNPHGDCIYCVNPAHCRCATFPRPSPDLIGEIVHFLFQLEGGLLQRGKQTPSLEA